MKSKILMPMLIIVFIVVIILVFLNLNDKKEQKNETSNVIVEDITETKQGNVEVTDVNINSDGSMTNVTAQVTNNDNKAYPMVDISIIFYDSDNLVLSTAKGLIENLAPGDKKGFSSSITGDFSKYSKYEVKIEKVQ